MEKIFCAWWNVENLFNVENYQGRSDKLSRILQKEIKGWNEEILSIKLNQLAQIINKLNNNKGPDILGVAEVEDKDVLEQLKNKLVRDTYSIVHVDSPDRRGIDVAFIYDATIFEHGEIFHHFVMKRTATRDIVQVNMKYKNKHIVFIGNHWPSRRGGKYETEPYRIIAGETLAYFHERIYAHLGENVPVLAMGDFNDTPFDRSITEYALATNSKEKIINAKEKHYFFNLMWEHLSRGDGTHYYDGFQLIDQFLISGNVIKNKSWIEVDETSCKIIKYPEMTENNKPIPFGRPALKGGVNLKGYSDHFPIVIELIVTD